MNGYELEVCTVILSAFPSNTWCSWLNCSLMVLSSSGPSAPRTTLTSLPPYTYIHSQLQWNL